MPYYALVDVNNFYASCERIFNPKLLNRPVIVLSNNDGCVIARSSEAKLLGIKMGVPYFQIVEFCKKNNVVVFSSNYALYGDISKRVMDTLQLIVDDIEIYSIDEAFLRLSDSYSSDELYTLGFKIRQQILQWIGVPVCVGIATSKTLAKAANHIAKKSSANGVFVIDHEDQRKLILQNLSTADIWGIGRQLFKRLAQLNIHTAWELTNVSPKIMRGHFGVLMERLVLELNGQSCLDLEIKKTRKQIVISRSFGKAIKDFCELKAALSCFAARAMEKLRQQKSFVKTLQVFIEPNRFNASLRFASQSTVFSFTEPTHDTRDALHAIEICLKRIFIPNVFYKKAGVILMDLSDHSFQQVSLFSMLEDKNNFKIKDESCMQILDQINQRMGKNTLFFAAQGVQGAWQTKALMPLTVLYNEVGGFG